MELYRRLIDFRKTALSPKDRFHPRRHNAGVLLFERSGPHGRFLLALNLNGERRVLEVAGAQSVQVATDTVRTGERLNGRVDLKPDEGLIVALERT